MMSRSGPFFGGIPTGPDVKKLEQKYGSPEPGIIRHEDIEAVISEQRNSARYRCVVGAWRSRLLREDNIATKAEPAIGIRILTEQERVDEAQRHLGLSARRVLRDHRWAMMIDASKLDELSLRKRDHLIRASAAMAESAATNVKALAAVLKAPAQLPRAKVS